MAQYLICYVCNSKFADLEDIPVKCDGCSLSFRVKCSQISATELKRVSLNNRYLKFFWLWTRPRRNTWAENINKEICFLKLKARKTLRINRRKVKVMILLLMKLMSVTFDHVVSFYLILPSAIQTGLIIVLIMTVFKWIMLSNLFQLTLT